MAMRCLVFASMLVVIGIVVVGNISGISAQIVDCGGNLETMFKTCFPFLKKAGPPTSPSQQCCDVLKNIDVPCFCKKYFKVMVEAQVSLDKALFVVRTCGHSVPTGFKCGNYTVPPPESAPKSSPIPEE